MHKVSIIVPVYNVEKYLAKCIDSIIAQEYDDWELILVNDGSSDSSKEICEEYCIKDNRISLYSQENAGPSVARNLGITKAKGEYITFIDSDDYVTSTYLSDLVKYDTDIIASGFDLWYSNGRQTEQKTYDTYCKYSIENNNISDALAIGEYKYLWHSPCCKLYRRTLLIDNNIIFDSQINYGEDHIFNLNVILHCKSISLVPVSNYIYTHYGNISLTNRRVPYEIMFNYLSQLYRLKKDYINCLGINDEYSKFFDNRISFYLWQTIYSLYQSQTDKPNRKRVIYKINKFIPKLVRNCGKLPKRYTLMRLCFNLFPFFISDKLNMVIANK